MNHLELDPHHDRFFSALSTASDKQGQPFKVYLVSEDEFLIAFGKDQVMFPAYLISGGDESYSIPGLGFSARDINNPHIVNFMARALEINPAELLKYLQEGELPAGIIGGPYALAVVAEVGRL